MTKAGNKILAGAREALAVAKGDIHAISRIKETMAYTVQTAMR